MNGRRTPIGAKGSSGLRALFCLCLLLSTAPTFAASSISNSKAADGVGTPPPALLEPQTRFGAFGGLERRLLGAPPVASGLWPLGHAYNVWLRPKPGQPNLKPLELAEMQQWRLEGG